MFWLCSWSSFCCRDCLIFYSSFSSAWASCSDLLSTFDIWPLILLSSNSASSAFWRPHFLSSMDLSFRLMPSTFCSCCFCFSVSLYLSQFSSKLSTFRSSMSSSFSLDASWSNYASCSLWYSWISSSACKSIPQVSPRSILICSFFILRLCSSIICIWSILFWRIWSFCSGVGVEAAVAGALLESETSCRGRSSPWSTSSSLS